MKCVLAIDSGGTKCDAVLAAQDGRIVRWGRFSSINPATGVSEGESGRSVRALRAAISQALEGIRCEELHLVIINNPYWTPFVPMRRWSIRSEAMSEALEDCDRHADRLYLYGITEEYPALVMAGEETGVMVLSGTGAAVFGCSPEGRTLRLDGLGPMLGDFGGAYYIGKLALQAAARSAWHLRHRTSLAPLIFQHCTDGMPHASGVDLIGYAHDRSRDRSEIASFAQLVDAEAEAGDAVARGILENAAAAMAETVYDVVQALGMADGDHVFGGIGSVAVRSRLFWSGVCRRVLEFAPRFRPFRLAVPPVVGFALVALRACGWSELDELKANLLSTAQPFLDRHGCRLPGGPDSERTGLRMGVE